MDTKLIRKQVEQIIKSARKQGENLRGANPWWADLNAADLSGAVILAVAVLGLLFILLRGIV